MGRRSGAGVHLARGRGGYYSSAVTFAAITAAWAFIVRSDPYYRLVDILGARVPLTMLIFFVLMPLAGLSIGLWRYDARHEGGSLGFIGKLAARIVHFTYVHLLIVLFTVAMLTDHILGLNIDQQVRSVDDRIFDLAARFAPWLAAYLAGFNLGRALRSNRKAAPAVTDEHFIIATDEENEKPRKSNKTRAKSNTSEGPTLGLGEHTARDGEPDLTASGLPAASEGAEDDQPGFLPPQDLDRIRPTLRELR